MKTKIKINPDLPIGAALMLFALIFYFEAKKITPPGATLFPVILLTLLFILAAAVFIKGLKKTLRPPEGGQEASISLSVLASPLFVYLLVVVYAVLLTYVGFFISTLLFTPAIMLYYGCRSWKLIASVSIGTCAFVYLLFVQILNVVLL